MSKLTKRTIVIRIRKETGLHRHQVSIIVQKVLEQILEALARNDKVELRNFGVFEVKLMKERLGRDPRVAGSKPNIPIPARAKVAFKPGMVMKNSVKYI